MKTNLLRRNEGRPLSSKFLRLFSLLAMLVVGIGAWADNYVVLNQSIQIGTKEGGWAGNTIPASAFSGFDLQAGDVIEISRSGTGSDNLQVTAGDWDDNFNFYAHYGWTTQTESVEIKEYTIGGNTYTADQIISKIKEKGLILNGTGPNDLKVRVKLVGNNRITLSGAISHTGMTDKVAQIGDAVTYTYTLDSKFADVQNVTYKWFIVDISKGDPAPELNTGDGYVYNYKLGNDGTSNTFTFIPRSSTSDKQLRVCVHVKAQGYGTDWNADYGDVTIAPMHKPTIVQDGTNVNISVNAGHWIKYHINGSNLDPDGDPVTSVYNNTATVSGLNDGDVVYAWTYRTVKVNENENDRYPHSESVSYTYVGNLHPDVECQNNTIDLKKLKPYGNVVYNKSTGEFTVSGDYSQYGNGLVLEFASPQNMSHVKTITINGAEFGNIPFESPTGNIGYPQKEVGGGKTVIKMNSDSKYSNVKKIDLREVAVGTQTISSIVFEYDHKPAMPQFTNGTTAEMTIYQSDDLVLSVEDGNLHPFWREYNENWNSQKYDRIPSSEYNMPVRTVSGLTVGTYYFAAERGTNCEFNKWHSSDLNKVKVTVLPTPTNLKVTYDLNAVGVSGSAPVDSKKYGYKESAVILAPQNISLDGYYFSHWSLNQNGSGERYSTDSAIGNTTISMTGDVTLYAVWVSKGYKGYFGYENRLIAQWNIDLSDGARLHEPSLAPDLWDKSSNTEANGDVKTTYTLNQAIGTMSGIEPIGGELVYATSGTAANIKIPVFAGLKFTAGANKVKILITKNSNGVIINTQLICEPGVKLEIPYVRNSYRNDMGSSTVPYGWSNAYNTKTGEWENYQNSFDASGFNDFMDCIHHVNRDIVYVVSNPLLWEGQGSTNKCYDDETKTLFNSGGDEDVHGLPAGVTKKWMKYNFLGNQGTKCIITFTQATTIDRIGVNRNFTYSFYTEHIAASTSGAIERPYPGLRIIGSPTGSKIADVGGTYDAYNNAIAMTYGGWKHNGGSYTDGDNTPKTDTWGGLTVYHGDGKVGDNDYTSSKYNDIDVTKVPVATDGFPVFSSLDNHAYSEVVNPTDDTTWHDANQGIYQFADNSAIKGQAEKANFTPWTLPCRGAYVKFEPTYPGVLNVHILQEGNVDNDTHNYYYIADEFGHIVKDNVFTKTGTGASNPVKCTTNGYFWIAQTDNVKYSFDVYPGKTYYLFSNTAKMGVTGFYFEPYVYRKYNALSQVPDTKVVNKGLLTSERYITLTESDKAEEYELARQDVGIKTATMSAGPNFDFLETTEVRGYTNQTAEFPGGDEISWKIKDGEDQWHNPRKEFDLDSNGDKQQNKSTLDHWAGIDKTAVASYPTQPSTNVNPLQYDNKAVHVTLNRSFTAGKWQTIVLPYSMNNLQLETVFGEGTKVVTLRDVQPANQSDNGKNTAYFVYHMNQDIIAGYPYLIWPTKNISQVETNAYLEGTVLTNTSYNNGLVTYMNNVASPWTAAPSTINISGEGPNLVTYDGHTYGGYECYTFKANYTDNVTVPARSYVMSKGNLTRLTESITASPFMAYIEHDNTNCRFSTGGANVRSHSIEATNYSDIFDFSEDEVVNIDDILLESGIVGAKTDVYSIDGQMVRKNTDDLSGLAKGIYIVNGKKYIVR